MLKKNVVFNHSMSGTRSQTSFDFRKTFPVAAGASLTEILFIGLLLSLAVSNTGRKGLLRKMI